MNVSKWAIRAVASATLAMTGTCIAEVGILDGADPWSGFKSNRSRADVQAEYADAKTQGLLERGDAERWLPESRMDIGARGPAGSRYSARTRGEVRSELIEYR